MKPWVDRPEVSGPALHALILGVSEYSWLPDTLDEFPPENVVTLGLTKLKTPAAGAFRFASWLAGSFWHPTVKVKTIRLLLTPSPEELSSELPDLGADLPQASSTNVQQALDEWKDACRGNPDGIAILYAAGHGIRWDSLYEAVILLDDFGKPKDRFLSRTIDLERTRRGMIGPDLPRTQYYFADSCKVNPDETAKWDPNQPPGVPISVSEPKNNAVVCAPLYSAAYPGQTAKGFRGEGTYFAEALVDSLKGYGWSSPNLASPKPIDHYFRITPGGLAEKLQERVTAIAARHDEEQTILVGPYPPGGMGVLCASPEHPVARFELHVSPETAAAGASVDLWDENGERVVAGPNDCHPVPLTLPTVRVGTHALELIAKAPFQKQPVRSVVVKPFEGWSGAIRVR